MLLGSSFIIKSQCSVCISSKKEMGSEVTRIPLINFSQGQGCSDWQSIKVKVTQALVEYGCFEAIFPDITEDNLRQLFDGVRQLFELPEETKQNFPHGKYIPGYMGFEPRRPLYQSFGFDVLENAESEAKSMWPIAIPKFFKMLQSYTEGLIVLNGMVRKMVAESFGIEGYIDEHMNSSDYIVRAIKYNAPKSAQPEVGIGAHTDLGYLSILSQCEGINGLQVQQQTKDGIVNWIDVNISPSTVIVMASAALTAWTNGGIRACNHQVIMREEQPRYSLAFSAISRAGYKVIPPHELIDQDHPLLFQPFEYTEELRKLLGGYY